MTGKWNDAAMTARGDWVFFAMVSAMAPFFLFPSPGKTWIFFFIPLAWAIRAALGQRITERTLIDLPIVVLVAEALVTCIMVTDIERSLPKVAGLVFGIIFYFAIVALLQQEKLIIPAIGAYIGGGFLFSILGLLGMFTFKVKYLTVFERIKDRLPHINFNLPGAEEGFHPNAVGGTLLLVMPLALALAFHGLTRDSNEYSGRKGKLKIFLCMVLFIFELVVVLLTQSRGTWIALILSSIIVVVLAMRKPKHRLGGVLAGGLSVATLGMGYVLMLGQRNLALGVPQAIVSFSSRVEMWIIGIKTIIKYPLTGIGMNQIRFLPEVGYQTSHVHNHLIHTGAEMGIPGLIAYLSILFGIAVMVNQIWKRSKRPALRAAALGLGWGQLAHFIFGMNDSIALGSKTSIFFWISAALISAIYYHAMHKES